MTKKAVETNTATEQNVFLGKLLEEIEERWELTKALGLLKEAIDKAIKLNRARANVNNGQVEVYILSDNNHD